MTKISKELAELQKFMNRAQDVYHWNELRDRAKEKFSQTTISQLDASAYIKVVKKNNKWSKKPVENSYDG